MKRALMVIDVQKDFWEGGVLPARDTWSLIQPLNRVIVWSIDHGIYCIFTRDWHPDDHCSFSTQGGPWPPHCVQRTRGAEFAEGLLVPSSSLVIDVEKDSGVANCSYSAFENTRLTEELRRLRVTQIAASGIATEYCVKATVLDAIRYGFRVEVLTDVIRPIDVDVGDSVKAIEEMEVAGAIISNSDEWMKQRGVPMR